MTLIGTIDDGTVIIGVSVNRGETYEEFFPRCVAAYEGVGKLTSEAEGICATTWQGHDDKTNQTSPSLVIVGEGETRDQFMDRCVCYYLGQAPVPRFINYICAREWEASGGGGGGDA